MTIWRERRGAQASGLRPSPLHAHRRCLCHRHAAERLLTRGLAEGPLLQPFRSLHTYAIATVRQQRPPALPARLRLIQEAAYWRARLVACLQRHGAG